MMLPLLGFFCFAILLVFFVLRMPAAVAALLVGGAGFVAAHMMTGMAVTDVPPLMIANLQKVIGPDALAMVVLFIFLGNIAFYSGISTRIYDAASVWLRRFPGGLAMAAILGCGGFSAFSGSSLGCAATMGRICLPEMSRNGYDQRLATSAVAVGGTLGSLIPPSILFIIYGLLTGLPVAQLFIAGILPGLFSLLGMLLVIFWWVREEPEIAPAPEPATATIAQAVIALWPPVIILLFIIAGLFSGLLSPWIIAAIAVGMALLIGAVQGRLSADILIVALRETGVQSLAILLVIAAASLLFGLAEMSGLTAVIVRFVQDTGFPPLSIVAIAAVIYLLLGMFIEPPAILVLTLPLIVPLVQSYDMNLIWFGVVVVKLLEIALITPPVGLNVFVLAGVSRNVSTEQVFAGVVRFLMIDFLVLTILILFPAVSTFLPALAAH